MTTLALALIAVAWSIYGLLARNELRTPEATSDTMPAPVLALALATLSCASFAAHGGLWPGGPMAPSTYKLLTGVFPLLASVRAAGATALGAVVSAVGLAGIGLAFVLRPLKTTTQSALTAAVCAMILAETFTPMLARTVYGQSGSTKLRKLAPLATTLSEYRAFETKGIAGPILDLPFAGFLKVAQGVRLSSEYTLLAAFHGRPTAACYNSFLPPSYLDVIRIAAMLPNRRGIDELAAAGLRNLVVRTWQVPRGFLNRLLADPGVRLIHRSKTASGIRITKAIKTHSVSKRLSIDTARVSPVLSRTAVSKAGFPRYASLLVQNHGDSIWALPHPMRPLDVHVRWINVATGKTRNDSLQKTMLPLALSPTSTARVPVELQPLPPAGTYRLEFEIPEFQRMIKPERIVKVVP